DRNVTGVQTCALPIYSTYKDAYGMPLLQMTYNFTDQDRALHQFISEKTTEIMKEMGPKEIVEANALADYDIVPYQSTHNTGGTRSEERRVGKEERWRW